MAIPTWAAHEMTHNTGSGALPASSIPAYLRDGDDATYDDGPSVPIFETTPTTKAAKWMCRRGNRAWGLPLALLAAGGYAFLATFLFGLHHVAVWGLLALFAWNAAKFALVGTWLLLVGLANVARVAHRGLGVGSQRVAPPSW
ncbi:hypothetical protein ACFS27_22925 [Promicromonospora vindobonensis]|uniref:Uncharacterized protein n=1 Tax=Promicromonospora vindobonensis TaxID=195748 RepID=A0ABW5W1H0_9MICO